MVTFSGQRYPIGWPRSYEGRVVASNVEPKEGRRMDDLSRENRRRVFVALARQASELEILASGRRAEERDRMLEEAEEFRDLAERFK